MKPYAVAGLKILRESFAQASSAKINVMAGSLAFTTVLSIAPLLAVMFFAFEALGYFDYAYSLIEPYLFQNLSPDANATVRTTLGEFLNNTRSSTVGVLGVAGLFLTAILAYNQVVQAMNTVMNIPGEKKLHRRATQGLTFIIFAPVLLGASIVITALIPTAEAFLGQVRSFGVSIILNSVAFAIAYTLLPNTKLPPSVIFKSATVMGCLWELVKFGYTIYAKKAVSYSKFYGSFSAVPLFLIWVYVGWYILLFGGSLARALHLSHIRRKR